eukprot:365028-Chlamydomonas_euryale.AAC.20
MHASTRLHHLYGKNWLNALRLVDEGGITCYVAQPSERKVFKVKGKTVGDPYLVFPRHFCSCHAFFYEVVCKSDALCVSICAMLCSYFEIVTEQAGQVWPRRDEHDGRHHDVPPYACSASNICKHQLAARIAALTLKCRTVIISDTSMAKMLMQSVGQGQNS